MKIKAKILGALLALFVSVTATQATTFYPAQTGLLDGVSIGGFTFHGLWYNYGYDAINAPFMEYYDQPHSITYDAGSFDFENMTLNGFPWDDYNYVGSGVLNFHFKDINGTTIFSDTFNLAYGNQWQVYSHNVQGVHEIYFDATNGFWPRLLEINGAPNQAVPDAGSSALLVLGSMAGLVALRRRMSR